MPLPAILPLTKTPFRWLGWTLHALVWTGVALAFCGIVAAPLGIYASWVERLTHVRLYWLGGLACFLVWLVIGRAWKRALAVAGLITAGLPAVIHYHRSQDKGAASPQGSTLTVSAWNVHSSNDTREPGMNWLKASRADFLLLTEVNPGWGKAVASATSGWPYQVREIRPGSAGICLFSRWPLSAPDPRGISPEEPHPWIHCTATTPRGVVRLIGMHPRTPRGGERFDQRNHLLDVAASLAAESSEPVILLGDLNCTPFSPWFARLLESGGLRDAAVGFGLTPTWRGGLWLLPIDHVLVSVNLRVSDWQVGEDALGSDHWPVTAILSWPE